MATAANILTLDALKQRGSKLRQVPWPMLGIVLAMCALGLAFIYSASTTFGEAAANSSAYGTSENYVAKQVMYLSLGLLIMLVIATTDYKRYASYGVLAFPVALGLLVVCMFMGTTINGAKAWIKLPGGFSLQVAEFCKLCYIVAIASLLRYQKNVESWRVMLGVLAITGIMLALILKQPDFGTAMIFVPVFFVVMWCSGARLRVLAPMLGAGAALIPTMYLLGLFKAHQMQRINVFLASLTGAPLDKSGEGYHISMSLNAIGSGGLTGKGYGEGTLSQFDYLPERHTDFIFSVIAEETGFVGALIVIALFMALLIYCLRVAVQTREPFGRTIAVGIATMFFAQFMINVGMTCGIMPVTGIPLPFFSYGGSSLLTGLMAIGLVMSVQMHPSRDLVGGA